MLDESVVINKNNMNSQIIDQCTTDSYIAIFLLLYITSSYYTTAADIVPGIISVLSLFFIVLISAFLNRKDLNKNFSINCFILLLFMFIVALLSTLIHGDDIYHYAIILFAVLSGYLISISYSFEKFSNTFVKIMYFLSAFSLVVFVVSWLYSTIIIFAPIIGQRVGVNVHNLFFAVALPGAEFNRNYGLFWEPGAFETYLNLALILELFSNSKSRTKYASVFIATILTTFSTTGYIAMAIILVAFSLNSAKINKRRMQYGVVIISIALVLLNLMPDNYARLLFGKLEGLTLTGENINFSTATRINAILYPINEFIGSPLIGIGYEKFLVVANEMVYSMPTCTPVNWFAIFGISWGIACNYYYLRNVLRFNCNFFARIFISISLITIISSEDFIRIAIIYVLIFYGAGNIKRLEKCA